jgi:DNA-binding transcriptional LysR family regulator
MELRHIRYFLAVAEEGNFTRAAEKLGIGQPPLSQQIKALEEEVGVRLFRRLPYGAELTEAGQAFLARVAPLPDEVTEAVRLARRAAAGETGTLRLGFTGTAALNPIVPECVRQFRRAHPDVELMIEETNSMSLIRAIVGGRLDVAILRPSISDPEELSEELLTQEELVAALPAAHPLATGKRPLDLARLADDFLILTPRNVGISLHDVALEACRHAGFEPKLGQPAPQIASILSLVAAELGFSLVPSSMAQLNIHGVVLRRLTDRQPRVGLAVAYRKGTTAVLVRNFVKAAREVTSKG